MDFGWVDVVVFGLVVALVASRFLKFSLPKDPTPRAKRPKGKDVFGRLHLDDLKMPEISLADDMKAQSKAEGEAAAARKPTVWDPERLKLGVGLEGAAKVAAIDPTFEEQAFLTEAKALVGRYYEAWNRKDDSSLAALCAPSWMGKINRHWRDGAWSPILVEEIESADVVTTRTAGRTAIVDVRFVMRVREGSASRAVLKHTEQRWVLARPFLGDDPAWEIETITTGVDA